MSCRRRDVGRSVVSRLVVTALLILPIKTLEILTTEICAAQQVQQVHPGQRERRRPGTIVIKLFTAVIDEFS
jgi:hypothetical protein